MNDPVAFWRLDAPAANDYVHARRNGQVEYTYTVPVTGCRECATRRGLASTRTLPVECPSAWHEGYELRPRRGHGHTLTNAELAALCARLEPELPVAVSSYLPLQPGDRFAPARWRVPSRPTDDFLWPEMGAALVSDRVRRALEAAGITGISFAPVVIERVGSKPTEAIASPRGGEPEDAWRRAPAPKPGATLPIYWHMNVLASTQAIGMSLCPECGAFKSADRPLPELLSDPKWIRAAWSGEDVFRPIGMSWVCATDRVCATLDELPASGVAYTPIGQLASRPDA